MSSKKLFQQMFALTLVILLLVGCGSSKGEEAAEVPIAEEPATAAATATEAATATLPPGPPCFGLVQADQLPEWAGGLAFGEKHTSGSGFTDLTSTVGCEVEGGVILINADGRFFSAYVDDCASFDSSDISAPELRPAATERWICQQPTGDGGIQFVQREG